MRNDLTPYGRPERPRRALTIAATLGGLLGALLALSWAALRHDVHFTFRGPDPGACDINCGGEG